MDRLLEQNDEGILNSYKTMTKHWIVLKNAIAWTTAKSVTPMNANKGQGKS